MQNTKTIQGWDDPPILDEGAPWSHSPSLLGIIVTAQNYVIPVPERPMMYVTNGIMYRGFFILYCMDLCLYGL